MVRFFPIAVACLLALTLQQPAFTQLKVLSAGSTDSQWRNVQLQLIDEQLKDAAVKGPLRNELEAQKRWLSEWKLGLLSEKPWMKQSSKPKLLAEPTIDPTRKATALRQKLLGRGAKPSEQNIAELRRALSAFPKDLGIQQLYLHWIDQRHYRDEYAKTVAEQSVLLANLLEQEKQTEQTRLARAFCYYRAARALIYIESEEAIAKKPIEDPKEHESQLLGIYNQLGELVGHNRPEFISVEIRMLRRDSWFGRALVLLEEHAEIIDTQWYLNNRRDLLKDLGWQQPAQEAAEIAIAFRSKNDPRSTSRPNSE